MRRYALTDTPCRTVNRIWQGTDSILKMEKRELMKGVYTYIRDLTMTDSDDYYFKIGKKSVILISAFTGQKYDCDLDLDMGDINSFRKGYVFIQRLGLCIMAQS